MNDPHPPPSEEPDDLDRLFVRAQPIRPTATDFGSRARERVRIVTHARRMTMLAVIDLAALGALAALAVAFGAAVAASGIPALLGLALEDQSFAVQARADLGVALSQDMPWAELGALALDALLLTALTHRLLRWTDAVIAREPPSVHR